MTKEYIEARKAELQADFEKIKARVKELSEASEKIGAEQNQLQLRVNHLQGAFAELRHQESLLTNPLTNPDNIVRTSEIIDIQGEVVTADVNRS